MKKLLIICLLFFISNLASAQIASLSYPPVENKTEVLILASPHLSQYKDHVSPEALEPLLSILKAWKPAVIGVEVQPSFTIAMQERNASVYEMVNAQFSKTLLTSGKAAQEHLGISYDKASSRLDSLQKKVGTPAATPPFKQSYILHLLASYHFYTALLHWYALSPEKKQQIKLPKIIQKNFETTLQSANEISMLALPLAKALKLDKIHQIDDHTDKDLFLKIAGELSQELQNSPEMEKVATASLFKEIQEEAVKAFEKKNILPLYLKMNSTAYQEADFDLQWNLFLRTKFASGSDRKRLAIWDMRNLNIAANIRRATALYPGKRVLIIIGSSHKIFLDNFLQNLPDIQLVSLQDICP